MNKTVITKTIDAIKRKCGPARGKFAEIGVNQVARLWREKDGSPEEFAEFCEKNFIGNFEELETTFKKIEENLEQITGHFVELERFLSDPINTEKGPVLPIDLLLAAYSPGAHFLEDFFSTKIAFYILLNFGVLGLEECLKNGFSFSRRKWAEARLTKRFIERIPASAIQRFAKAETSANDYIGKLNFYVGNIVMPPNLNPFPKNAKWQSHWQLRDHLKEYYAAIDGLPYQEILYEIMLRVIEQSVPKILINNPKIRWEPFANKIFDSENNPLPSEPENNERYRQLLDFFSAIKEVDKYRFGKRTFIDAIFDDYREIPEKDFEKMMVSVLESPVAKKIGSFIEKRLGRPLKPFDIWYEFDAGNKDFSALNQQTKRLYPNPEALEADLPNILMKFGFNKETAEFLGSRIHVDEARTSGHCCPARRKEDSPRMRVRFPEGGLDYKEFTTAMHELFHGVEMVFSFYTMDYGFLAGVPAGNAVTEAFAFFGQQQSFRVLAGGENKKPGNEHDAALNDFWKTFEIGGVGLLDLNIWRWMYKNPNASPAELKEAVESLAKDIWNRYFAPVFGLRDEPILAIYSHIIHCGLYTPDYFLGHVVCHQITEYLNNCGSAEKSAEEIERMCKIGKIAPDIWMRLAVGNPISARPLIEEAGKAIASLA